MMNRRPGFSGNSALNMLNTSAMSRSQSAIMKGGIGLSIASFMGGGLAGLSAMTKAARQAPLIANTAQPKIGMANVNYSLGADPFSGMRFAGRYRRNI